MAMLRARQVLGDGRRTVIVVESAEIRTDRQDSMFRLAALKKPVAVVVAEGAGARAIGMTGEPADLDRLAADVDGLSTLLELHP